MTQLPLANATKPLRLWIWKLPVKHHGCWPQMFHHFCWILLPWIYAQTSLPTRCSMNKGLAPPCCARSLLQHLNETWLPQKLHPGNAEDPRKRPFWRLWSITSWSEESKKKQQINYKQTFTKIIASPFIPFISFIHWHPPKISDLLLESNKLLWQLLSANAKVRPR